MNTKDREPHLQWLLTSAFGFSGGSSLGACITLTVFGGGGWVAVAIRSVKESIL